MCKRLLLLIFIALPLFNTSRAFDGIKEKKAKSNPKSAQDLSGAALAITPLSLQASFSLSGLYFPGPQEGLNGSRINPNELNFAQGYALHNLEDLQHVKSISRPYFSQMEEILNGFGLPKELKYLAVIESELNPSCRSGVGALGPWQLMPETARLLGLKVGRKNDERRSVVRSTQAAALYLKDLYTELGDWLLVIAAYNGGTNHVYQAIKKSHSREFWDLQKYLPAESRNHVKKYIATHYIFEGQGGVTTLTHTEAEDQLSGSDIYVFSRRLSKDESLEAKAQMVSGKYCSEAIAKYVLMDLETFNRYNPEFDKVMNSSNNTYELKLPSAKWDLFMSNKYDILNESVQALLQEGTATSKMPAVGLHELARKTD